MTKEMTLMCNRQQFLLYQFFNCSVFVSFVCVSIFINLSLNTYTVHTYTVGCSDNCNDKDMPLPMLHVSEK